jgi:hypothetical protein
LLNCKNISWVEKTPELNLSRAFKKRHGEPLHKYRILTISPGMSKATRPGGQNIGHEILLPHHLVRGHFKTYSPERPLLGKYFGRFFWAPQARGDGKNGTIDKDYKVAAPLIEGLLSEDETV